MQEEANKFLEKENKELLWKLCRDLGAFSDTPEGNDDFSKLLDLKLYIPKKRLELKFD